MTFRLIRKDLDANGLGVVEHLAAFWEGPTEAGETGQRVTKRCHDHVMWRWHDRKIVGRKLLNTAPSVGYYSQLAAPIGLDKPIPKSATVRR